VATFHKDQDMGFDPCIRPRDNWVSAHEIRLVDGRVGGVSPGWSSKSQGIEIDGSWLYEEKFVDLISDLTLEFEE
jgi:hypothetical protein